MTSRWSFSRARFRAILVKEFIQMFRDRLTFAMMVGIPIMQLEIRNAVERLKPEAK